MWDWWNRWRAARYQRKVALRAEAFWRWFRSTSEPLPEIIRSELSSEGPSPNIAAWVAELNRRAAAYHPAVRAVLGRSPDAPELVVTSEGNPAGAEHVRFLVASRPPLPAWTIRAFKPPLPNCVVHFGPITLTPDDVEFAVIDVEHPDIGKLTLLLLFVPGLANAHEEEVRFAARKLVEGVLGEETFLPWSSWLVMEDRERPAEKVAQTERQPLRQLPAFLNAIVIPPSWESRTRR